MSDEPTTVTLSGASADTAEDGSVGVRTLTLVEPLGQHPRAWRERRVAAENALADLTKRFTRKGYALTPERVTRILEDSLRLLTQSMVAEGRLTQEQLQKCLSYWLRVEPNRRDRLHDSTRPADFGPSPADTERVAQGITQGGVLSLSAARARKTGKAGTSTAGTAVALPEPQPPALRPLVEAYQYVVGEMIAYRVITDDEAQARLCETQLLYLRPLYEQALALASES